MHLAIGRLRIVQGTITYTNPRSGQTVKAEQLDLTASVGSLDGPFSISGKATVNGVPLVLDLSVGEHTDQGNALALTLQMSERQARLQGHDQRSRRQRRRQRPSRGVDRPADRLRRRDGAGDRPGGAPLRLAGRRRLHLRRRHRIHADAACRHRLQDDAGRRDGFRHAGAGGGRGAVAHGPRRASQGRDREVAGASGDAGRIPAAGAETGRAGDGARHGRVAVAVPARDERLPVARYRPGALPQGHGARRRGGARDPQGRDRRAAAQGRAAGRHGAAGERDGHAVRQAGAGSRAGQRPGQPGRAEAARHARLAGDRPVGPAGGPAAGARPQGHARLDGQRRSARRSGDRSRRPACHRRRLHHLRHAAGGDGEPAARPFRSRCLHAGRGSRIGHARRRYAGRCARGHVGGGRPAGGRHPPPPRHPTRPRPCSASRPRSPSSSSEGRR